jgi:hypothetical protein
MSERDNGFSFKDGISLREYFDVRLKDIEKATELASQNLSVRLESMNEFRNQMKDQTTTFVTRNEIDAKFKSIEENRRDNMALIVAVIGIIIGLIGIFIKLR